MQATSPRCRYCSTASLSNGNWKGGRTLHTNGYVQVSTPGHPRGYGSSKYVFEHILVMEKRLGRYLLPGENVHHKNGNKQDNGDDNLELWVKSQPAGIRVTDAIEWAKEILRRYETKSTFAIDQA